MENQGTKSLDSPYERFLWFSQVSQTGEPKLKLPLWFYRSCCQITCASMMVFFLVGLGAYLLSEGLPLQEIIVSYGAHDVNKTFNVGHNIDCDVFVYYELPSVYMNSRNFVESKDSRVVSTLFNKVSCKNSDTQQFLQMVRGEDEHFLNRTSHLPGLAPCGLISFSMFTDEFKFARSTSDGNYGFPGHQRLTNFSSDIGAELHLEEFDLALPADESMYQQKFQEKNGQLEVAGITSWLSPGPFFEHWKVWCRTPASPQVRNLWAVIRGGLAAGEYQVTVTRNSPIWESWGVPEKRIILSPQHSFGNKGAMKFLGGLCIAMGILEAGFLATFVAARFLKSPSGSYISCNEQSPLVTTWGKSSDES